MAYVIAILGIEMIALIVFAPIKIGVRAHFSLAERGLYVVVKLFGINAVRIRVKSDKSLSVTINGKKIKHKGKKPNAIFALTAIKDEKIAFVTSLAAICGTLDEKDKAIVTALCQMSGIECRNFANCSDDGKFDCELRSKFFVNLAQAMTILSKSR